LWIFKQSLQYNVILRSVLSLFIGNDWSGFSIGTQYYQIYLR
jgi:hypothetical protein